jgi:hypothetical protein
MAEGKKSAAAGKTETRVSYAVDRAFVHEGRYYAGQDVPEIGDLPKDVVEDRLARGYIREFNTHSPAPAVPGAPPVNAET